MLFETPSTQSFHGVWFSSVMFLHKISSTYWPKARASHHQTCSGLFWTLKLCIKLQFVSWKRFAFHSDLPGNEKRKRFHCLEICYFYKFFQRKLLALVTHRKTSKSKRRQNELILCCRGKTKFTFANWEFRRLNWIEKVLLRFVCRNLNFSDTICNSTGVEWIKTMNCLPDLTTQHLSQAIKRLFNKQ